LLDYLYGFGVASASKSKSKLFLWLSVINNLGILAIFKYYNFFVLQVKDAFEIAGIQIHPTFLNIALPVGISFYTFHGMSYVFDIYRAERKPVKDFVDYAVFVSFFPLLVAGPIERANHLLPQVQKERKFDYQKALEGCRLILWGLVKKVVIADSLAITVDSIFNHYQEYHFNALTLIIGAVAFSFQIYGDFSGYSDIALGSAKLLGFELLSNFKFPYFSRDNAEFWRRWHISLSSWFRDYLYIPLGGSKVGKAKAVRNTFIIFLVSGFWHGASWNFIIWGFIHACGFLPLLLLNRNRKNINEIVAPNKKWPTLLELLQMLFTFGFVTFAWIFFRANNLSSAVAYLKQIMISSIQDPSQYIRLDFTGRTIFLYVIPTILIDWQLRRNERVLKNWGWIINIILAVLVWFCISKNSSFIYFQF
jgi:D-alanyl-lipoteichoic acid acyltransferase DltB (MBOAT superfamily)